MQSTSKFELNFFSSNAISNFWVPIKMEVNGFFSYFLNFLEVSSVYFICKVVIWFDFKVSKKCIRFLFTSMIPCSFCAERSNSVFAAIFISKELSTYLVVGVCTLINVFLGQVDLVGCLHPEKLDCTQKSTLCTSTYIIYYILHSEVNKAGCLKHESRAPGPHSEQNQFQKRNKRWKCEVKTN